MIQRITWKLWNKIMNRWFLMKYLMKITFSRNNFEIFSNTKHVLVQTFHAIPVSSKFRYGNYSTRHARWKFHFEKCLVTKYEKWLRSTIDFTHSSEKSSHSLSATYAQAQDPISKRERSLSYGVDSIYGASSFSGGGPRWYRGEA